MEKDISEETLRGIINYAVLAPSAFNLQPWEIIIIKSEESKQKLYKICEREKILESPATLIITHNRDANTNENLLYKIEPEQSFGVSNIGLLSLIIMYSASMYNIKSYPLRKINSKSVQSTFQIPSNRDVVMLISLDLQTNHSLIHRESFTRFFDDVTTII